MEKKQSSIDYFFEEVVKWEMRPWLYASDVLEAIREQAKAMHKEEIQSAIIYAEREHNILGNVWPTQTVLDKAEKYYNETFGGDNE